MGVNTKKIDRMVLFKENLKKFQDFLKTMDLNPIVEYFELGLEAREFRVPHPTIQGKQLILGKNHNLFFGFNHKGYQYTLRRQPLNTSGNNIDSITNEMFQGIKSGGIK